MIMLGIFLASFVAAMITDVTCEERNLILSHGQKDALYLIMIGSILGMIVTVPVIA